MDFYKISNMIIKENVLGLIEDIDIEGIGKLKAKTDTGNEAHNVLHGTDITINNNKVTFKTDSGSISLPLHDTIKIHIGDGNIQDRPVVLCNCIVNGERYENIPFSVCDRSENSYKVLLGAPFIKEVGGKVDVHKRD
jgi:hypothetical protein